MSKVPKWGKAATPATPSLDLLVFLAYFTLARVSHPIGAQVGGPSPQPTKPNVIQVPSPHMSVPSGTEDRKSNSFFGTRDGMGVGPRGQGLRSCPSSGLILGWEDLLVCELSASMTVSLNFTPKPYLAQWVSFNLPRPPWVSGKCG
jgi:hypothetical protein